MNKIELKKVALESLDTSGSLYAEGRFQEALEMARKAWNAYFELQKERDVDEDYTDMIYCARSMYEKCQTAVNEQPIKPTKDYEYAKVTELKEKGERGDHESAILAADWYADTDNWSYLDEKGISIAERLSISKGLYRSVVDNLSIWVEFRVLASVRLGNIAMLPKYGMPNMREALDCYRWAADRMPVVEKPTDWLLRGVLERTVQTAIYLGDIATARQYIKKALDHGIDKGIYFPIAYHGLTHHWETVRSMISEMVDDAVWQGFLLHGVELFWRCVEADWEDTATLEQLQQTAEQMSIYSDNNQNTEGGYACLAFSLYVYFLCNGLEFFDKKLEEYFADGLNDGNEWCRCYYGLICDGASTLYAENGDSQRADEMRREALKYLSLAADNGNREALKNYIFLLKEIGDNSQLIEKYEAIGRQYDIIIKQPEEDEQS